LADEELLPKGLQAHWTAHIGMPNNICLSALRFPYTNDPRKLARVRERAVRQLTRLAT
jgi:hypothetical protein